MAKSPNLTLTIPSSSAEALKDLVTKRSSVKGRITKFKNFLNSIITAEAPNETDICVLVQRYERFRDLSFSFDELQSQIELINESSLEAELDIRETFELEFTTLIAQCKLFIEKNQSQNDLNSVKSNCSHACQNQNNVSFKLPVIKINPFDGAYFKWLEFRDTFISLIHNNQRIEPIHKFHYLNSYLEKEASSVISNLEISAINYEEAWHLLCERYNNEKQLINNHLNSLLNLQSVPRDSAKDLRALIDHVSKNLRALNTLGEPTQYWDTLIIHLVSAKLDPATNFKWEEHKGSFSKTPSLQEFFQFLKSRSNVLETIRNNKVDKQYIQVQAQKTNSKSFAVSVGNMPACILCNGSHRLYNCSELLGKDVEERIAEVVKLKLCLNCLRKGHSSSQCRLGPCNKCKKKHNTLLHRESSQAVNVSSVQLDVAEVETNQIDDDDDNDSDNLVSMSISSNSSVLLSTALVDVYNPATNKHLTVRALLDSASQCSLITNRLKSKLQLDPQTTHVDIVGVGNVASNVMERCIVHLRSKTSSFRSQLSCLVLPEISGNLPNKTFDISHIKLPQNIKLADPSFNHAAPVDLLLGADIFWHLLENYQIHLGHNQPALCKSKLGWVLAGPIYLNGKPSTSLKCHHVRTTQSEETLEHINQNIIKFWELEKIPEHNQIQTDEDIICETHFVKTTSRNEQGRFSVRLPLITEPDCLGDSMRLAKRQFIATEKRLNKNAELKQLYVKFINEYSDLGHLSEIKSVPSPSYFIPHHAVLKPNSESTALRVVFNGNAKSSSSYSINDLQMVGPHIQDNLFNILLRFRLYTYVMSGDVEKMYRQVEMQDDHRNLQIILWRENSTDPLKLLRLNTITYGYTSSSFLSTRCLWQLGEDCHDPRIKEIIQKDFLVDDLLTGSNDPNELLYIKQKVENALSAGCFNLRKYRSNLPSILVNNNEDKQSNLTISSSSHTLGVGWNPNIDVIHFPCNYENRTEVPTKRTILSDSCKIFDPFGLLSLLTITPKILIQKLWLEKIDWDVPVPDQIKHQWNTFANNLKHLHSLSIPRHVLCKSSVHAELHIFCDASLSAMAATVYIKSVDEQGNITVRLLCAKARVASVKPITIPRMELSSCLLGAQLAGAVSRASRCVIERKAFWTDSTIALSWLGMRYDKLKTFVANRVSATLELTEQSEWRHVPTDQNPADLATRGLDASKVKDCNLWWNGPAFLREPESTWPSALTSKSSVSVDHLPEIKVNVNTCDEVGKKTTLIDFDRYSKLSFLQRTFAYILRFIKNCRDKSNKHTGILQPEELNNSLKCLVKLSQEESFPLELKILRSHKPLNSKSHIVSLSPFLENNTSIIRVGGRLENSIYPYNKRHPMLIHAKHKLAKLLFQQEHLRLLHAGPQLLLSSIRESVWPIAGRDLARTTARQCVICRKVNGNTSSPIMGMLPKQRINPGFAFDTTGLDMAGPYLITDRKGRGCKISKCYLCIFVCFRYKCVHLEAVSELSKDAFILSFRRFISRRGRPSDIFCDNGRNFVAASKDIGEFLLSHANDITSFSSSEGIKFNFQPAYAPHFGGLWESAVKSAKSVAKRVFSNTHLTFEELATLFSQIEAVLNSRPICPLSSSPNDLNPLTPGHFLIGRALMSLPSPDLCEVNSNRLNRFQRLEQLRQHFWKRWQTEYLAELQEKHKWRTQTKPMKEGDLVLLKEENAPPMQWRLGRIISIFPGRDGVARVADVKTTTGTYRRGIKYLCPLLEPKEDEVEPKAPMAPKAPEHVRATP